MASTDPASTEHVEAHFDIPAKTKAGVVVNEGPDFRVEVQEVDVPEPGLFLSFILVFKSHALVLSTEGA